jgi:hypothetical protein
MQACGGDIPPYAIILISKTKKGTFNGRKKICHASDEGYSIYPGSGYG